MNGIIIVMSSPMIMNVMSFFMSGASSFTTSMISYTMLCVKHGLAHTRQANTGPLAPTHPKYEFRILREWQKFRNGGESHEGMS